MPPIRFPHPGFATPEGIVALGGALSEENLLEAYSRGIFPWPIEGLPLTWFCPPWRAILKLDQVHIPRSLVRARKNSTLRFTINQAFEDVIRACSRVERAHEKGTWINPRIIRAYCGLHARGAAHSVEAWEGDILVAGVYGVDAGGVFGGESMFHLQSNASKLALLFLFDHLRSRGAEWTDIQVMSPHMEALGAIEISRGMFLKKLADAQMRALKLF